MRPSFTRVVQVTYEGDADPTKPWKRQTRITAVILYPTNVKRHLAMINPMAHRLNRDENPLSHTF